MSSASERLASASSGRYATERELGRSGIDVREIGKKLDVGHLLEGSVRRAGDRLRITAQLIKVKGGGHLWSEKYDRAMSDVFSVQDEIALAIVDRLKVKLLQGERQALAKRYTDNLDLYNLYLLGRHHWNKFTPEGLDKSEACYEQALAARDIMVPFCLNWPDEDLRFPDQERFTKRVREVGLWSTGQTGGRT